MTQSDDPRIRQLLSGLGGVFGNQFTSPNETDRNGEPANIVDALFAIARALADLADAVREHGDHF